MLYRPYPRPDQMPSQSIVQSDNHGQGRHNLHGFESQRVPGFLGGAPLAINHRHDIIRRICGTFAILSISDERFDEFAHATDHVSITLGTQPDQFVGIMTVPIPKYVPPRRKRRHRYQFPFVRCLLAIQSVGVACLRGTPQMMLVQKGEVLRRGDAFGGGLTGVMTAVDVVQSSCQDSGLANGFTGVPHVSMQMYDCVGWIAVGEVRVCGGG
mmetsp:Transcript_42740/g.43294  ORF Transcript_42740/g.43294 Transcript_42740/m.43294 type:complete len:212 (+) Transcript_42740:430-1065(+)